MFGSTRPAGDGEAETADRNSGFGGPFVEEREGKGSVSGHRPIGAAADGEIHHRVMPSTPLTSVVVHFFFGAFGAIDRCSSPLCTLWSPALYPVVTCSVPCGHLLCTLWSPALYPVVTCSVPCGHLLCTLWSPALYPVVTCSVPCGHLLCTLWSPALYPVVTCSVPCGHLLCTLWSPALYPVVTCSVPRTRVPCCAIVTSVVACCTVCPCFCWGAVVILMGGLGAPTIVPQKLVRHLQRLSTTGGPDPPPPTPLDPPPRPPKEPRGRRRVGPMLCCVYVPSAMVAPGCEAAESRLADGSRRCAGGRSAANGRQLGVCRTGGWSMAGRRALCWRSGRGPGSRWGSSVAVPVDIGRGRSVRATPPPRFDRQSLKRATRSRRQTSPRKSLGSNDRGPSHRHRPFFWGGGGEGGPRDGDVWPLMRTILGARMARVATALVELLTGPTCTVVSCVVAHPPPPAPYTPPPNQPDRCPLPPDRWFGCACVCARAELRAGLHSVLFGHWRLLTASLYQTGH